MSRKEVGSLLTKTIADLKKQSRFADTGSATYKDQAALNSASTQYAVKFPHTGRKTDLGVTGDFTKSLRSMYSGLSRRTDACSDRLLNVLFNSVPRTHNLLTY